MVDYQHYAEGGSGFVGLLFLKEISSVYIHTRPPITNSIRRLSFYSRFFPVCLIDVRTKNCLDSKAEMDNVLAKLNGFSRPVLLSLKLKNGNRKVLGYPFTTPIQKK